MRELIFTITCLNMNVDAFLFKYEKMINAWYQKSHQSAYIEVIKNGFLYIIKDLEYFLSMLKKTPTRIGNLKIYNNSNHEIERELENELTTQFQLEHEQPIILEISNSLIHSDQMIPAWKQCFESIDPNIDFKKIGDFSFSMIFPTLRPLIQYLTIVFNLNALE